MNRFHSIVRIGEELGLDANVLSEGVVELKWPNSDGSYQIIFEDSWVQIRVLMFDVEDINRHGCLSAISDSIFRMQFRILGVRFALEQESGIWIITELYPSAPSEQIVEILQQISAVYSYVEPLLSEVMHANIPASELDIDMAFGVSVQKSH